MEKSKFLYGALGFLALGLASCSSDDLGVKAPEIAEIDEMRYIAVQISSPRDITSRAFEDGTANESYVNRLDFFFYDVVGNPTSTPLTMVKKDLDEKGTFTNINKNENVSRIYTSVVPVALTQGQNLPSQVICIVNGLEGNINDLKTKNLTELINTLRDSYRNGDYFLMSNSVYYGQDILTGQANQRLCATPINANSQLFGTEQQAKDAITNAATAPNALVDIYVERLAAKVGLTMAAEAVKTYVLQNGDSETGTVSLTYTPEYWAMNATDEQVYLTKRYGVEQTEDGKTTIERFPDYAQINSALTNGGFTNWNDAPHYRSYWGCSPSYFENEYPDVSDDVNDLDGNTYNYHSNYYSYKEIAKQAVRTDAGQGGIGKQALAATDGAFSIVNTGDVATGYIYTRESTVAKSRINDIENSNPAAAVASAVLVGKYKVTGAEGDATTFYVDRNAGEGGTYYANATNAINTLAGRQSIVFTDVYGNNAAGSGIFTLAHPKKAVREIAKTKLAGRVVTLQLASVPANCYYYNIDKVNEGSEEVGGYELIDNDNLDKVNAQLLSVGYMDMFYNGLAFYSVPIRHLNWNDNWYKDGEYIWKDMQSGSLGVVRNHVYTLSIKSISGLGTALRSDDQPIVPAKTEANQFIAARLNILAWNIVSEWGVDL